MTTIDAERGSCISDLRGREDMVPPCGVEKKRGYQSLIRLRIIIGLL